MKRRIKYSFLAVVLMTTAIWSCKRRAPQMVDFNILLQDSTTVFNSKDLPTGKPVLAVYFSPDCSHCQEETKDVLDNISKLQDVTFVYVTPEEFSQMKTFIAYYNLNNHKNFIVGKDINWTFYNSVKPSGIPFSCLYDKEKQLRVVFPAGAKSKELIESLNKM